MTAGEAFARYRYLTQIGLVACVSWALVIATDRTGIRSPFNLFWMIGLPALVGMTTNVGWDRRCFMAMALIVISVVVSIAVGVNFTSYD